MWSSLRLGLWGGMNDPASLTALQANLVFNLARDVQDIILAAKRAGAKPSSLDRREYENLMESLSAPTRYRGHER